MNECGYEWDDEDSIPGCFGEHECILEAGHDGDHECECGETCTDGD